MLVFTSSLRVLFTIGFQRRGMADLVALRWSRVILTGDLDE
jgi:hypothetical protein